MKGHIKHFVATGKTIVSVWLNTTLFHHRIGRVLTYILQSQGGAVGSEPNEIVCDVQSYDPKHNSWKLVTSLPQPERGAVAANLNGTVYLMGQNKAVYSYNRWT